MTFTMLRHSTHVCWTMPSNSLSTTFCGALLHTLQSMHLPMPLSARCAQLKLCVGDDIVKTVYAHVPHGFKFTLTCHT